MRTIQFTVYGDAKPAGSKRGFATPSGKVIITDACKTSAGWKQEVKALARKEYAGPLLTGPVSLSLIFYRLRPNGHFGTGRNFDRLKESAPEYPTGKPDVLKLARAVEDALTGIVWRDDSQIVVETLHKLYCENGTQPRVAITVTLLTDSRA